MLKLQPFLPDHKKTKAQTEEAEEKVNSATADTTSDSDQESQNVMDKRIIVLDPGHSAVVATGMEPIGPGASEQKAADASGTSGVLINIKCVFAVKRSFRTTRISGDYDKRIE